MERARAGRATREVRGKLVGVTRSLQPLPEWFRKLPNLQHGYTGEAAVYGRQTE